MHKAKKQPAKRKYVKKSSKWANNGIDVKKSEANFKQAIDEFQAAAPKTELDEIEFLDAVVTGVGQMTNDQKSRFMNYMYSRYWPFITLSKLTQ
jgi:hypothetical protein